VGVELPATAGVSPGEQAAQAITMSNAAMKYLLLNNCIMVHYTLWVEKLKRGKSREASQITPRAGVGVEEQGMRSGSGPVPGPGA
jgi:hypothetical protein